MKQDEAGSEYKRRYMLAHLQGELHIASFHYAPLWASNCIRLQQPSREARAQCDTEV